MPAPVLCLSNSKLSYLLSQTLSGSLVSQFCAGSSGKIPVSGGRGELVKFNSDLCGGMLREKAQKGACWIGGFLTRGCCSNNDLGMRRGAFMPL